jgi:hypothetical protein
LADVNRAIKLLNSTVEGGVEPLFISATGEGCGVAGQRMGRLRKARTTLESAEAVGCRDRRAKAPLRDNEAMTLLEVEMPWSLVERSASAGRRARRC